MTGTTTATTDRPAPRADCAAGPGGDLTFDLDLGPDLRSGAHESGHEREASHVLLLRLRGAKDAPGPRNTLRLPLAPLGDRRLRAVLPPTSVVAEGRWDVHLQQSGAEAAPAVEPGLRDLRTLVDRVPEPGPVVVRIPYPTLDGRLAVRCWLRSPHAEAAAVIPGPESVTVRGALYGTGLGEDAYLEARLPGDPGGSRRVPVAVDGAAFSFTLPYGLLTGAPVEKERLWRLRLFPGADATSEGVRVAHLLDDIWDRKKIFVYPERTVSGGAVAPCYTSDNDLCVRFRPVAAGPS